MDFEQLIIWINGKIKLITHLRCLFSTALENHCARIYFIVICIVIENVILVVQRRIAKFRAKHLWQNLSFKRLYYRFFPVNFLKNEGPLFLQNTFGRLLLYLEPCQVSMIEVFCGNSKSLTVFAKKTPSYIVKRALITDC